MKMGPKAANESKPNSSKKAVRAKKEQKIEDLTFGIKNKNKSSKVKLFIDRAEKCVKHSFGDIDAVRSILTWNSSLNAPPVALITGYKPVAFYINFHVKDYWF